MMITVRLTDTEVHDALVTYVNEHYGDCPNTADIEIGTEGSMEVTWEP